MNWSLIAALVLLPIVLFGDKLLPLLRSIRLPSIGGNSETGVDDDADLAAFKRLRKRLAKCKEAQAGLDSVWQHFWHTGGDVE